MALPKIQQPLFELTVPSTKKKVKYRPFTVKEEKVLLIAQESKDVDQIIMAIKQIINNCVTGIDVDKLAMFDLEFIMINLRARSVSNIVEFRIKDEETEEEVDIQIDIGNVKMKEFEGHNKTIALTDDITIGMKYPQIDQMRSLRDIDSDIKRNEALFNIMIGCIDVVVQDEEVYRLSDFSQKEIDEFIDGFTSEHINKLTKFFDTMPVLRLEAKYVRKDGVERTFVAQGTESFFI